LRIEVWKTTIEVQQHFNEIEWKIRGLALTLVTGVLGASAFAAKDGTTLNLHIFHLKLAAAILIAGAFIWSAFYVVDKVWYHRLLMGSVRYGETVEKSLGTIMPGVGLTTRISQESPYKFKILGVGAERSLHSDQKLSFLYWSIGILLLILAAGAQIGVSSSNGQASTTPTSTATTTASPHIRHTLADRTTIRCVPFQAGPQRPQLPPGVRPSVTCRGQICDCLAPPSDHIRGSYSWA
jgi:hypothetical protein